MKAEILTPKYCETITDELLEGVIYISHKYEVAIHLCACGCKQQTVTPFGNDGWKLEDKEGKITLRPSIGNFSGESPYHAHYYITESRIEWV